MPDAPSASPTPTPTPEPKAELSPTATVDPAAASAPVGGDDAALEASFSIADTAPAKPAPKVEAAPVEAAKPAEVKPEEKAAAELKVEEKSAAPVEEPERFASNKEMRQELARRKAAIAERDTNLSKLAVERDQFRSKVEELSKAVTAGDAKVLSEQLAASEKRIETLQTKLTEYDYRNSKEYEQNFQQRWNRTAQRALADVSKLPITHTDENGTVTQSAATAAHLERIVALNDPVAAQDLAEEWFGKRAPLVMMHYNALRQIQEESQAAIEQHKTGYAEKQKTTQAEQVRQTEFAREAFNKYSEELTAGRADLFTPAKDDAEHADTIQKAIAAVDGGLAARQDMPLDKRVKFDALLRHHAISSLIQEKLRTKDQATLKASTERIAELEAQIKELRGSGPGPAKREGDGAKVEADIIGGDDSALKKAFGE